MVSETPSRLLYSGGGDDEDRTLCCTTRPSSRQEEGSAVSMLPYLEHPLKDLPGLLLSAFFNFERWRRRRCHRAARTTIWPAANAPTAIPAIWASVSSFANVFGVGAAEVPEVVDFAAVVCVALS